MYGWYRAGVLAFIRWMDGIDRINYNRNLDHMILCSADNRNCDTLSKSWRVCLRYKLPCCVRRQRQKATSYTIALITWRCEEMLSMSTQTTVCKNEERRHLSILEQLLCTRLNAYAACSNATQSTRCRRTSSQSEFSWQKEDEAWKYLAALVSSSKRKNLRRFNSSMATTEAFFRNSRKQQGDWPHVVLILIQYWDYVFKRVSRTIGL